CKIIRVIILFQLIEHLLSARTILTDLTGIVLLRSERSPMTFDLEAHALEHRTENLVLYFIDVVRSSTYPWIPCRSRNKDGCPFGIGVEKFLHLGEYADTVIRFHMFEDLEASNDVRVETNITWGKITDVTGEQFQGKFLSGEHRRNVETINVDTSVFIDAHTGGIESLC